MIFKFCATLCFVPIFITKPRSSFLLSRYFSICNIVSFSVSVAKMWGKVRQRNVKVVIVQVTVLNASFILLSTILKAHLGLLLCLLNVSSYCYCQLITFHSNDCHKSCLGQKLVFVVWLWKALDSRWGPPWELSSFIPWFMLKAFLHVCGTDPVWTWSRWFRGNSTSRERAPRIWLSVLLISLDNFLVFLHSISSETWVIEFSCELATLVFCARLFLGISSQFTLFWAASFLLLLRVAV